MGNYWYSQKAYILSESNISSFLEQSSFFISFHFIAIMIAKWIIKILLYVFCSIGFLYQSTQISVSYFEYFVMTKIQLIVPEQVIINDYAICVRYTDLITGNDFIDTPDFIFGFMNNHTLQQLFDSVPQSEELIDSCNIHRADSFLVISLNRSECYEIFNVTRYIYREFLCYELHYKNDSEIFSHLQVSGSFLFAKTLYRIKFNDSTPLNNVRLLIASAYFPGDWIQYASLQMTNDVWTKRSANSTYNYYTTKNQMFIVTLLEPPYETSCFHYGNSSKDMCVMNCLKRKSIQQFNAIPSQVVMIDSMYEMLDIKQIDERYVNVADIVDECKSMECTMTDCIQHFTSSYTDKDFSPQLDSSSFLLGMASTPDTVVSADPDIYLSEYILYLMSLAGSWFGFSMIALDPYELWMKFKRRKIVPNSSDRDMVNRRINYKLDAYKMEQRYQNMRIIDRFQMMKLQYDCRIRLLERKINNSRLAAANTT